MNPTDDNNEINNYNDDNEKSNDENIDFFKDSTLIAFSVDNSDSDADDDANNIKKVREYLLSVRAEAKNSLSSFNVLNSNEQSLPSSLAFKPKRKCSYLQYLTHLNKVSSDDNKSLYNETWKNTFLQQFSTFRQYLTLLSQRYIHLSGDTIDKDDMSDALKNIDEAYTDHYGNTLSLEEDDFDWESLIISEDVTLTHMGAMNTVKSCAVIEHVAQLLMDNNKRICTGLQKDSNADVKNLCLIFPLFKRILQWGFAALASLDELQAISSETANHLQIIRRCCRWLTKTLPTESYCNEIGVLQFIIEEFFQQK